MKRKYILIIFLLSFLGYGIWWMIYRYPRTKVEWIQENKGNNKYEIKKIELALNNGKPIYVDKKNLNIIMKVIFKVNNEFDRSFLLKTDSYGNYIDSLKDYSHNIGYNGIMFPGEKISFWINQIRRKRL